MLTIQEIKTFIDQDAASEKKKTAKVGVRYYENDTDIQQYRIFFVDADGKLKEDETKSNIKISHPFFKLLVDQQAQYMLSGGDAFIKSDIPELQTELDAYFNENEVFIAELLELISGAVTKGREFMYAYQNAEGKTAFMCADYIGVVECEAKYTADHKDYIIYWYVERTDTKGNKIKRIQVWDEAQTYFYSQKGEGEILLDNSVKPNPRPHIVYQNGDSPELYYDDYGVIPFFPLDNGKKQTSGVLPIKGLIDSYELMNCGLVNNIQDTNEALYVVKGFEGDNLDELMLNIRSKKHIGVTEEGGVDIKTIDIPVEARKAKMEIDEKNIFRFGMGVNTEALKDTSATTSVAIKSAYANLDMKCEGLMPFLKAFLRKVLDVVLREINTTNNSAYAQKDIYFDFQREIITNAQENAQIELVEAQKQQAKVTTIQNVATLLGNELAIQLICEELELDYDDIKDKLPNPDDTAGVYEAQTVLDNIVDEPEGDIVE